MNYRNILGIIFFLFCGFGLGITYQSKRIENIYLQVSSIAEKSYFTGCLEQVKLSTGTTANNNCRVLSLIHREGIEQTMNGINGKSN